MKVAPSALAPLFRSNAQGDLLALLLLNPEDEFSLSEIGREIGALPATVHREAGRLVQSLILTDRTVGRSRMFRANTANDLYRPLVDILVATYGPKAILRPVLAALSSVHSAYIYGSWAARYSGEGGPPPGDIDVLVVGATPRSDLVAAARSAEPILRREVNITRLSVDDWETGDSPFVSTLKARPLVDLKIEGTKS